MSSVEYVVGGWALTGLVFAVYWLWIVRRTRRAEQSFPGSETE